MGLNNYSIHFVEYVRWKIFLRILNKSKGSISLGLDSIDMLVPVELTVYLNTYVSCVGDHFNVLITY